MAQPLVFEADTSRAAIWAARTSVFGALVALIALGLSALNAVGPLVALVVLGTAALFAALGLALALRAIISIWQSGKRGVPMVLAALFLSVALLAYPAFLAVQGVRLPTLNDVTTDITHPPEFSRSPAALAARGGTSPGIIEATTRDLQEKAYPDVQPIIVDVELSVAYGLALKAVAALGWQVVDASPPDQKHSFAHIDVIDRTPLLHFTDDITIRIQPLGGQTRLDLRSVSRLGKHDFGTNAKRILKFIREYQQLVDNS